MKILKLKQGGPDWLAARANYHCASEAAAMMGTSAHMTRNELLALKRLGIEKQASYFMEQIRKKGHASEARLRPIVEERDFAEDLYPVTILNDAGTMLASLDGAPMSMISAWESKQHNAALAECVRNGALPDSHWPQLEHQMLASDARIEKILFTVELPGNHGHLGLWYESRPERRAAILAGWAQFDKDLAGYEHVVDAPKAQAAHVDALPALVVRVTGAVTESNLEAYRERAMSFILGINRDLQTDQDFADAEANVKRLDEAEKKTRLVMDQIIGGIAPIEEIFTTLKAIIAEAAKARLALTKDVDQRKTEIKDKIRGDANLAFKAYVDAACRAVGRKAMPVAFPDFVGALKGKRTLSSMRNACDTLLASAKIEVDAMQDRIATNIGIIQGNTTQAQDAFLFRDRDDLTVKDPEAVLAIVQQRVSEYVASEEKRVAQEAQDKALREAEEADRVAEIPPPESGDPGPGDPIVYKVPGPVNTDFVDSTAAAPAGRAWILVSMYDVPLEYLMPNEALIDRDIRAGLTIPGIRDMHKEG